MTHRSRRQAPYAYGLPKTLTFNADTFEQRGVNMDDLTMLINKHERIFPRYLYLENLYHGFFGMLTEEAKEDWKPKRTGSRTTGWRSTSQDT